MLTDCGLVDFDGSSQGEKVDILTRSETARTARNTVHDNEGGSKERRQGEEV